MAARGPPDRGTCETGTVDLDRVDWDLRSTGRRQRWRLLGFAVVFVVGTVLASTDWRNAGLLLVIASMLGLVGTLLMGMFTDIEAD